MNLINFIATFAGAGLIGAYGLKLKGTQAWSIFLVAWFLLFTIVLHSGNPIGNFIKKTFNSPKEEQS